MNKFINRVSENRSDTVAEFDLLQKISIKSQEISRFIFDFAKDFEFGNSIRMTFETTFLAFSLFSKMPVFENKLKPAKLLNIRDL